MRPTLPMLVSPLAWVWTSSFLGREVHEGDGPDGQHDRQHAGQERGARPERVATPTAVPATTW